MKLKHRQISRSDVFGFVNQTREFPDKRDLNRVFPGSKKGSLASRFAFYLLKEIIPHIDYAIDFHAGGASRFNAPQIRIVPKNAELKKLADIFHAPFGLYSKNIAGSFRNACDKLGVKMLLFEGGKSVNINEEVTQEGIEGTKRVLDHLGMLSEKKEVTYPEKPTIYICAPQDPAMTKDENLEGWFVLVNAPTHGQFDWSDKEFARKYANSIIDQIEARGISVRDRLESLTFRTPADLEAAVHAPGGAIYGTSSNGARAAFMRAKNRSPIKGLYLVGGSAHPGGGLPLVGISGDLVTEAIGYEKNARH